MKPGTKSRKVGLQIPTVNPCNDFIVDYLIRNKIKSDKQVLCKSFLYNLAIEAVRKYPLPLICEEQLAALQGFGNFFIGQVGRLIKRHYNRGRLPTQKQMEQDDQYHFEVLRAKNKPTDDKTLSRAYTDRDLDSPIFSRTKQTQQRRKNYRPKKNTQPYNILESLVQLGAVQRAVTKGDLNEVLFNKGKQKIRLWYMLRQKLQEYDLIQLDAKNEDYIYLTQKGKKYIQTYDKQEQLRAKWGRRKVRQQEDDQQDQQQYKSNKVSQLTTKKKSTAVYEENEEQQKIPNTKPKSKSKAVQEKIAKIVAQMQIKKTTFPKNTKFQSIDLIINQNDSDLTEKQGILQNSEQLNYQFKQIQLADFLWATDEKILDYIAIRIKSQQFDEQEFKTICFRAKMTTCQNIFIILEGKNAPKQVKSEQSQGDQGSDKQKIKKQQQNAELKQKSSQQVIERMNYLLASALIACFKVIKTQNLKQTMKFVEETTYLIFQKLQNYQSIDKTKRNRKQKNANSLQQAQDIKYFGTIDKFNKKISTPYEISTITTEILKTIPDLSLKCIKILQEKLPTLAALYKKIQNSGTTKEKKLFLRSYLIDQKINDESLNILVQVLFYETY